MLNRIRQLLLILCAISFTPGIKAQVGGSYFADFELKEHGKLGLTYSMAQDAEGHLQMATIRGVVVFDGAYSQLVGTGAFIYKLEYVPDLGRVYAGCSGRIGYIQKNTYGKYLFTRIDLKVSDEEGFSSVTHLGSDVYFMSPGKLVKVSNDKVTNTWGAPKDAAFTGLFNLGGKVFVNVEGSGLHSISSGNKLEKHPVSDGALAEDIVMFSFERGKTEVVLGTSSSRLLIFNGATLTELTTEKGAYLQTHMLWQGGKADNNQMVLATKTGGLMVVNMFNGAVSEIFNTGTGFPDNQVSSMLVDKHSGIWVSHDQGLTRIDRMVPVRNYSSYPGLTSRVTAVAEANGTLYAGTSEGVFWLKAAEAAEFENAAKSSEAAAKINKIKQESDGNKAEGDETPLPQPVPTPTQEPVKSEENKPRPGTEQGGAGKKLKDMWRKAKQRGSDILDGGTSSPSANEKNLKPGTGKLGAHHAVRSVFRFASFDKASGFQYVFAQIKGIEGKTRKLVVTPLGLVCGTSAGLYLYNQEGVKTLFRGDVQDVVSTDGNLFFLSSGSHLYAGNIRGDYTEIPLRSGLKNLSSLLLEKPQVLWVGASNKAARLTFDENLSLKNIQEVSIPTEFIDLVTVVRAGDNICFALSSGLYDYDASGKAAVQSKLAVKAEADGFRYIVNSSTGGLFIRSAEGWKELRSGQEMSNVYLMDVVRQVRYVFQSPAGSLWIVGGDGRIYLLKRNIPGGETGSVMQVFIRSVSGFAGNAFDLSNLHISHDEAEVEIRWGCNVLLNTDVTWYQYKIEGAGRSSWSPWTNQTSLKIRLQPGSYTFVVRARDPLGNVSPEKSIRFTIEPPFWQTWWFYTFLVLLLAGLIYMIFRWRNRALLEKQKELERMVKLRTEQLQAEKEKAENLLLNILPAAVAEELQNTGKSSVRQHDDSAVMFTDFCDFTLNSKGVSPQVLVHRLDIYFQRFDQIVEKYGLEKIKTIGDAYMCAAGVPEPKKNSTLAVVMAGLEMLETVKNEACGWKIRLGIHQGSLVSGVVGKKKFAYDIWGDTVNIASRMESSGAPMKINISEQVYHRIKDYFDCEVRGEVEAKSLGKTNMYFVNGLKSDWRQNGHPLVPSKQFLALLN